MINKAEIDSSGNGATYLEVSENSTYTSTKKYKDGKLHCEDGPAVHWVTKPKCLYQKYEAWYKDGMIHRDGAPAKISDNYSYWYQDDQLHREDGPAIESDSFSEWYFRGEKVKPEKIKSLIKAEAKKK